jgi:hypothetical protein
MNSPQNIPSHDAISDRARRIWESSGQIEGQDLTHWLQAEKELMDEAAASSRDNGPALNSTSNDSGSVSPSRSAPSTAPRDPGSQDRSTNRGKQARPRH